MSLLEAACAKSETPEDRPGSGGFGAAGGGVGQPASGAGGSGGDQGPGGASANDAGRAECNGPPADVSAVADGTLVTGSEVVLDGVVATSQKFLIARSSSSGACLWGVFVADPAPEAAPHQGVLVVSYGAPAQREAGKLGDCRPGADAIPDGVAIGDVLRVAGKTDVFEPSNCPEGARPRQLRLRVQRCPIETLGSGAPPVPALLDVASADLLARGGDAAAAWAGVLLGVRNVSGVRDGTNRDVVGAYGTIQLDETALTVEDRVYYWDLAGAGPGAASKAPEFGFPTLFERIDGLAFLDHCDWVLAPRDRCADFTPPSAGCP